MTATLASATAAPTGGRQVAGHRSGLRWVLDPGDDVACVQALTAVHDRGGGTVVCPTTPDPSWPALVADLLTALGKDHAAPARAHRRSDRPALVQLWLRAHQVRDLVVLRAHTLRPAILAALCDLTAGLAVTVWLVWHRRDAGPPVAGASESPVDWVDAAWLLDHRRAASARASSRGAAERGQRYRQVRGAARREARAWANGPPRVDPRHCQPGFPLGAALQRLTIDVGDPVDLVERLDAMQAGFRDEALHLALPPLDASGLLGELGPRLPHDTMVRLGRLVCPTIAAALMLTLATDKVSSRLAGTMPSWIPPDLSSLAALGGQTYRIPRRARVLLTAAVLNSERRGNGVTVLPGRGGRQVGARRMASLVRDAATQVDLPVPTAAQPGSLWHPAAPFAAAFTTAASVTPID